MPRNSNGVYALPAGNPTASGTTIATSWSNPTMADIAAELTNSLDRSGRGGMLGAFLFFDGTQSAPGGGFTNDVGTGFYRAGTGDLRFVTQAAHAFRLAAGVAYAMEATVWEQVATRTWVNAGMAAETALTVKLAGAQTITGTKTFSVDQTFNAGIFSKGGFTSQLTADIFTFTSSMEAGNTNPDWQFRSSNLRTGPLFQVKNQGTIAFSVGSDGSLVAGGVLVATQNWVSANAVMLTGNQNISGVKTFNSNQVFNANLYFNNNFAIIGRTTAAVDRPLLALGNDDNIYLGNPNTPLTFQSNTSAPTFYNGTLHTMALQSWVSAAAMMLTGDQTISGSKTFVNDCRMQMSGLYFANDCRLIWDLAGGGTAQVLTRGGDNAVYLGTAGYPLNIQSSIVPSWYDGTTTRNFATQEYVDAKRSPIAAFRVIINSGTTAPSMTTVINTTGGTFSIARTGAGQYRITLAGSAVDLTKTISSMTPSAVVSYAYQGATFQRVSATILLIEMGTSGGAADPGSQHFFDVIVFDIP